MPVRLTVFMAMVAFFLVSGSLALAKDDPAMPWVVTRSADNRVLPKQDTLEDIRSGRAMPDQQEASAPALGEKSAPATTSATPPVPKSTAKPAPVVKPAPVSAALAAILTGSVGLPVFDISADKIVITIPTSQVVVDTRYMNLDKPRRLAVDIMGTWTYKHKNVHRFSTGAASKAVIGVHKDFLRLVLHLTQKPVAAEIAPSIQLVQNGLRVTIPLTK